jgi:hypothetical protein
MSSDRVLKDLVMEGQQPHRAGFIRPHLTAKADNVGKHDRRQLTLIAHRS